MADNILILKDLTNENVLDELSRNAGFDSWANVLDYADSCGGACPIDLINPYIYRYDIEGLLQQALEHPEDTPLIAHAYNAHLERMAQEEQKQTQKDMRDVQETVQRMREELKYMRSVRDFFDKYGKRG